MLYSGFAGNEIPHIAGRVIAALTLDSPARARACGYIVQKYGRNNAQLEVVGLGMSVRDG